MHSWVKEEETGNRRKTVHVWIVNRPAAMETHEFECHCPVISSVCVCFYFLPMCLCATAVYCAGGTGVFVYVVISVAGVCVCVPPEA